MRQEPDRDEARLVGEVGVITVVINTGKEAYRCHENYSK